MEKKSGFGKMFTVVAVTFALVVCFCGKGDLAHSADSPKDKAVEVKATLSDKKAKASETDVSKTGDKVAAQTDPTELLIKGSKTFMEGVEMSKSNKDKTSAQKMMLEGHKMMAETEASWAKTNKEFSPAQKTVSEGHALMMKGYTLLKGDKDAEQGAKMVNEGYRKIGDGLKSLQVAPNGKDKK